MPKLYIVVDVPDEAADPTTTDPHEIAEDILHSANENYHANGDPIVRFVSAEWLVGEGTVRDGG